MTTMHALIARDRTAGVAGLELADMPYPHAAENDVIVECMPPDSPLASSIGRPPGPTGPDGTGRRPFPGHEVAGVVAEFGYGTTGLTVGQRVFGITDWSRNGTLAEFVAVEARNLVPLSADIDPVVLQRCRFQVSRHGRDSSSTADSKPARPS